MNKNRRTLCILGCGGFIGSHLLDRLLEEGGCRIIGIDAADAKIRRHLGNPAFSFVKLDIRSAGQLRRPIEESDIVVLLAALCMPSLYNTVPLRVIENDFTLPCGVAALCSELGKWLIHFSTCEVYGRTVESYSKRPPLEGAAPFHEDTTPLLLGPIGAQRWSYACAKQLLERAIVAHHFEKGLDYTIIRPFNFIGPRMDFIPAIDGEGIPRVVACFMEALFSGKPLKLVDGGKNRRSFTFISDAIDAVMAILSKPDKSKGQIFNIGNPANEITIEELARRMKRLFETLVGPKRPIKIMRVASRDFYGEGYEDCDRRIPDIAKARTLLGWEPKLSLDESILRTMKGFIEEYGAKFGNPTCQK
jgi:UDP-apiose/xylose synthase